MTAAETLSLGDIERLRRPTSSTNNWMGETASRAELETALNGLSPGATAVLHDLVRDISNGRGHVGAEAIKKAVLAAAPDWNKLTDAGQLEDAIDETISDVRLQTFGEW